MKPYANCDYDVFVDAYHNAYAVDIFDPVTGEVVRELENIPTEAKALEIAESIIDGRITWKLPCDVRP